MKFKTIFSFEYMGYLKNKIFVGVTVVIFVVILILAFVPNMYEVYQNKNADNQLNKPLEKAALIGEETIYTKNVLSTYLPQYEWEYFDDVSNVKENIESNELKLAVEISAGDLNANIYVKGSDLLSQFSGQNLINEPIQAMMVEIAKNSILKGLDNDTATKVTEITNLEATLNTISIGKDSTSSFWFGYVLVLILYISIVMYGQFILISVIAEKSSKAMELLITSAKPTELMFGKVLGVGCAALTQLGLILTTVFAGLKLNQNAWEKFSPLVASMLKSDSLSFGLLIYFFIFFVLGFFLFAFINAALASTTSRMEDANTISLVPVLLSLIGFFVAIYGIADINSTLVKVFSFIPFSSPMVMFMRICVGDVSSVEIISSVAVLAVTVYLTGFIGSKIYRLGLLMYGNRPSLRNIVKMIGKA